MESNMIDIDLYYRERDAKDPVYFDESRRIVQFFLHTWDFVTIRPMQRFEADTNIEVDCPVDSKFGLRALNHPEPNSKGLYIADSVVQLEPGQKNFIKIMVINHTTKDLTLKNGDILANIEVVQPLDVNLRLHVVPY